MATDHVAQEGGDLEGGRSQSKKRRIPGACDICKRKKIRCDSGKMPDNRCTNCVQFGLECTHKEVTKTLGSAKGCVHLLPEIWVTVTRNYNLARFLELGRLYIDYSYVESLEARLEKMDRLLNKLLPGLDINQELDRMSHPAVGSRQESEDPSPSPASMSSPDMLTIQLDKLKLNPDQNRYFGKSSGHQLVATALNIRQEYIGAETPPLANSNFPRKRHEFWDIPKWVAVNPENEAEECNYTYPDEDLIPSLIDHYFVHINAFMPLLHRPTFEKSLSEGLHHTNSMFGATLLLVCAHGARYSDDPRVLAAESPRSAGWKWFEQVNILRKSLYHRTSLYELQMHALYVFFAHTSEMPQGIWSQIGLAVRMSQEVGAHRKRPKKPDEAPTAEDELWKRAFWVLLTVDRQISAQAGRPCALQDEDFDLDLPLECDDEYWENGFQQPPDKPSSLAFFNCHIKLMDILAYAMRLIYSIKRPMSFFGNNKIQRSEEQVIAELDSAMNSWMDSVPSHLRWNPNRDNELFLKQSAALHSIYYNLQIFIHRPFIPSPENPIPVAFPCMAICTNAARSACHVLETFSQLNMLPFTYLQNVAFTAAVILLLNIWSGKRSGIAPNPRREMEDVQRCLQVLKCSEKRWASAGRYCDILTELAFAGEVPVFENNLPPSATITKKRARDEGAEDSPAASSPVSPVDTAQRSLAGTRRASVNQPSLLQFQAPLRQPLFSLPMYGNQLGRLPIYGQFNFSDAVDVGQTQPHTPYSQRDPNIDQFVLANMSAATAASMVQGQTQGQVPDQESFVIDSLYNGQDFATGNAQNSDRQPPVVSNNFASLFGGNMYGYDDLSRVGTMPAMDNDTMTMWSTAPTGLELQLDEWNNYLSNVEQITQGQGHNSLSTHL